MRWEEKGKVNTRMCWEIDKGSRHAISGSVTPPPASKNVFFRHLPYFPRFYVWAKNGPHNSNTLLPSFDITISVVWQIRRRLIFCPPLRRSAGPNISIASTPWFPAFNFLSPFLQISGERGEGNKRCLFVLHMGKGVTSSLLFSRLRRWRRRQKADLPVLLVIRSKKTHSIGHRDSEQVSFPTAISN